MSSYTSIKGNVKVPSNQHLTYLKPVYCIVGLQYRSHNNEQRCALIIQPYYLGSTFITVKCVWMMAGLRSLTWPESD